MTACLLDRAMIDSNIDYGALLSFKQIWTKVKKNKKIHTVPLPKLPEVRLLKLLRPDIASTDLLLIFQAKVILKVEKYLQLFLKVTFFLPIGTNVFPLKKKKIHPLKS